MPSPVLVFHPRAFLKLQYLCHEADTEIGGWGITRPGTLEIIDFKMPKQDVSIIHTYFDPEDVIRCTEEHCKAGNSPNTLLRVWIHTHPGTSAAPSHQDEETFRTNYGTYSWAIMFILARGGRYSCRLKGREPLPWTQEIEMQVDWSKKLEDTHIQTSVWDGELASQIKSPPDLFEGGKRWLASVGVQSDGRRSLKGEAGYTAEDDFYYLWEAYQEGILSKKEEEAFEDQLKRFEMGELDFDESGNLIGVESYTEVNLRVSEHIKEMWRIKREKQTDFDEEAGLPRFIEGCEELTEKQTDFSPGGDEMDCVRWSSE